MSTAEMKSQIIEMLGESVDESTLSKIIRLFKKSPKATQDNWWESLSEESAKSITKGLKDANEGNFVSSADVKARANKVLGLS
jgi:hypothetical protein